MSATTTTTTKVDVFISGAGPVGLFFAYQMAMRGHSIFICDYKPGPTLESRAASLTARSMELFEARGLAGDFIAESFAAKGIRVWRNGKLLGQFDYGGDTAYGQLTIISQSNTESILNRRLEADTDSRVHWETELVSYVQDEEKVVATVLDKKTGEEHKVESTFIVGADGSRSKVRKENEDWTFNGTAEKTQFALADIELSGKGIEEFSERLNLLSRGPDVFGMIRLNPLPHENADDFSTYRIFGNLTEYNPSKAKASNNGEVDHGLVAKEGDTQALTLEFIQSWLDRFTDPFKLNAGKLIWASQFKVNERIVNGYRRSRAFLIGDAAHCHSPAGGLGLSLGLQDADNLVWKISDVLKGITKDPERLLNSYNLERYPLAEATLRATSNSNDASFTRNELVGYVATVAAFAALKVPQVRNFVYERAMQLNICIDPEHSTILGKFDKGLVKPGQFLPNHEPLRKAIFPRATASKANRYIQRQTLRDILVLTEQTAVIYIGTRYSGAASNQDMIEKFWVQTRSLPVKRLVVQSVVNCKLARHPGYIQDDEKEEAEDSFYNEERIDTPLSLTKQIGLLPLLSNMLSAVPNPPGVLLVVRPDFYISQAQIVHNEADLMSSLQYVSDMFVDKASSV
ncbi:FAD binding domain-containing protein [Mucor lusitanicus]|uniref:FAD-binding domain-containing protein n=2 Tax=Mucor circinelloides f. lusitanicus TaxID=29924 RepID=A0A168HZR7_MUCCL|nr:FAD binding domain-containing protein [Mucor lusitanicus]OAC99387.1 hypothetical protein MUCCIDRAFT_114575 [Mucor lusitanicus CBS 277.49]